MMDVPRYVKPKAATSLVTAVAGTFLVLMEHVRQLVEMVSLLVRSNVMMVIRMITMVVIPHAIFKHLVVSRAHVVAGLYRLSMALVLLFVVIV